MGDRTYVTLTVLTEHAVEAMNLIQDEQGEPCDQDDCADGVTRLGYQEVNYGVIDSLDQFSSAGIPYSVEWGSGGSYSEGEEHVRFDAEGNPTLTSHCKDWQVNVLIDLQTLAKKTPDKSLETLLSEQITELSFPSWENQLEHSKIARTRNLLNPQ